MQGQIAAQKRNADRRSGAAIPEVWSQLLALTREMQGTDTKREIGEEGCVWDVAFCVRRMEGV